MLFFCSKQVLSLADKRGRNQPPGEGFGTGKLTSWNQGHGQVSGSRSAHTQFAGLQDELTKRSHGSQKMVELKSITVEVQREYCSCPVEGVLAWFSLAQLSLGAYRATSTGRHVNAALMLKLFCTSDWCLIGQLLFSPVMWIYWGIKLSFIWSILI